MPLESGTDYVNQVSVLTDISPFLTYRYLSNRTGPTIFISTNLPFYFWGLVRWQTVIVMWCRIGISYRANSNINIKYLYWPKFSCRCIPNISIMLNPTLNKIYSSHSPSIDWAYYWVLEKKSYWNLTVNLFIFHLLFVTVDGLEKLLLFRAWNHLSVCAAVTITQSIHTVVKEKKTCLWLIYWIILFIGVFPPAAVIPTTWNSTTHVSQWLLAPALSIWTPKRYTFPFAK